jgi:hypothetical protein
MDPLPPDDAYDRHRQRAGARQAGLSARGRDIGPIPEAAHPLRRKAAARDFHRFATTYLPHSFPLPFSEDHLRTAARIEAAVLKGELYARAMPRGSGKTTLVEAGALWAVLYGHRSFVVLIGNGRDEAVALLESIKFDLETNERLLEDFPEVCVPVQALEGIVNRCKGQTCEGHPTRIEWADDKIVLPHVARSKASGAVVRAKGLMASLRGMKHKLPGGRSIRPDLVILDDPQDEESAESPSQCAKRERVIAGSVLNLAGPGQRIAALAAVTVIRQGDLAERLLDRKLHPEWQGERAKMVYAWPERMDLWDRYADMRRESLAEGRGGAEATAFYALRRADMDRGAQVYWPERWDPGELSAVQHAFNKRILVGDFAFEAEYQNEPRPIEAEDEGKLTPAEVMARVNRHKRGSAPRGCARLTAFVDVQGSLLYWLVAGWSEDFTGAVLDYGSHPEQGRAYWTLRDARKTLGSLYPGGMEAAIAAGLAALWADLLGREWPLEGGGALRVERCLVDANWGESTELVYRACRMSPHAALLTPSHGKGITAGANPIGDWTPKKGERRGINWIQPLPKPGRLRHVLFDANYWKSFVAARLRVPAAAAGALTLFGDQPAAHRLLADHLTAEYRVRTRRVGGREVDEWKQRPEKPDNHLLDALVGAAVAASMQGCALPEARPHRARAKVVDARTLYDRAHQAPPKRP